MVVRRNAAFRETPGSGLRVCMRRPGDQSPTTQRCKTRIRIDYSLRNTATPTRMRLQSQFGEALCKRKSQHRPYIRHILDIHLRMQPITGKSLLKGRKIRKEAIQKQLSGACNDEELMQKLPCGVRNADHNTRSADALCTSAVTSPCRKSLLADRANGVHLGVTRKRRNRSCTRLLSTLHDSPTAHVHQLSAMVMARPSNSGVVSIRHDERELERTEKAMSSISSSSARGFRRSSQSACMYK